VARPGNPLRSFPNEFGIYKLSDRIVLTCDPHSTWTHRGNLCVNLSIAVTASGEAHDSRPRECEKYTPRHT